MRVSVVIVNFNTGGLLEQCLASIEEKFRAVSYEVIVVDNASTDSSEEAARRRKEVVLVAGKVNIGFAAGCNIGTQMANGESLLFLNPDTSIISNEIKNLLDSFEKDETAGALGCQNRLPSGAIQTSAYNFPGLFQLFSYVFHLKGFLEIQGLRRFLSAFLGNSFGQFHHHRDRRVVDWVTGAFLLIKRKAWIKAGSFDQRFFLFCEEIDWCLRLKKTGMNVVFDPSFEIEHHVGYSSQKVKPFVMLEKQKSYLRYFEKHSSAFGYFFVRVVFYIGVWFWKIVYSLKGEKELHNVYAVLAKGLSEHDKKV